MTMTQDVYREELITRGLDLWHSMAKSYQGKLERYEELLEEKRRLGIKPIRKINKTLLAQYPKVPILLFSDEEELRAYLEELSTSELCYQVKTAEEAIEGDGIYHMISERVISYSYEIRTFGKKVSELAAAPSGAPVLIIGANRRSLSDE